MQMSPDVTSWGIKSFRDVKTPREVDRKLYAFLPSASKGFDGVSILLNPVRSLSEGTDKNPDLEFWGGEQIIPSAPFEPLPVSDDEWQQPASFNKPGQVSPADMPLPEDLMEHQDGALQNCPDFQEESHVQSLKDLLTAGEPVKNGMRTN
ncbi:hypothetical protein Q9966_015774 [Columba livia]|nr:hypothetical protein Q9966_015774 [Columba livia]